MQKVPTADWIPGTMLKPGDMFLCDEPRSKWAILWDRILHPLTEPAKTEKRYRVVIDTFTSDGTWKE